jgi:hypothetical protein
MDPSTMTRHGACSANGMSAMDSISERESMEWIRRASEYRTLTGKRDQLGFSLGEAELARLAELEEFFLETIHPARATYTQRDQGRVPVSLVVTFSGRDGNGKGRARDISGQGLYVETPEPLPVGAHTVVAMSDRETQEEWHFSAEVVRISERGMGLRFLGIPLALRVGHRGSPTVRKRPLRRAA